MPALKPVSSKITLFKEVSSKSIYTFPFIVSLTDAVIEPLLGAFKVKKYSGLEYVLKVNLRFFFVAVRITSSPKELILILL